MRGWLPFPADSPRAERGTSHLAGCPGWFPPLCWHCPLQATRWRRFPMSEDITSLLRGWSWAPEPFFFFNFVNICYGHFTYVQSIRAPGSQEPIYTLPVEHSSCPGPHMLRIWPQSLQVHQASFGSSHPKPGPASQLDPSAFKAAYCLRLSGLLQCPLISSCSTSQELRSSRLALSRFSCCGI